MAFGLSLALVLTRATMLEVLRDPLDVAPGSEPAPRGPGAGAGLVLDLVAWVPALLVLARGALDAAFRVRVSWANGLLTALAGWAVLSTVWADDKFAALVSGFHWLSAGVFLWSASQLVRSWRRLRLVAGACTALLLVYGAQALSYRYIELPELRSEWQQNGAKHLRDRGFEPGSYAALVFEGKILRGEMIGFGASSNTFAAVTVLLMVVTAGAAVQRLADGDDTGWVAVPAVALALGVCIVVWTDSKTAYATPLIAAGILATLAFARGWLARRARVAYFTGVGLVALGAAAVVGHGTYHGSLVIDSMTFRWRYWVGAARLIAENPLLGVGWDNFGLHYLAHRLPTAAEEIRDPHNFLVRFFAELGAVGGALALAWMLRLWWELARPRTALADALPPRRALPTVLGLAVAAGVLSTIAFVDFGFVSVGGPAGPAYVFLRVLERLAAAVVVATGIGVVAVRSVADAQLDDRPAPWVLYGILAGLGVFLLHNLVDFSMFEVGPMFLFAGLAGSTLGARGAGERTPDAVAAAAVPAASPPRRARRRVAALATVAALWLAAGAGLALPVLLAEEHARAGDEHLRQGSPAEAANAYHAAAATVPYNADYPFREARALATPGAPAGAWRPAIDAAIRANPASAGYWATRGGFEAATPQPDAARVRADFEQALALNPADVPMRTHFAESLEKLGFAADARAQYEQALSVNDQLLPDDAERLPPAKVREIRERIRRLGGG